MSEITLDEKVLAQFLKQQNNLMEQTNRLLEKQNDLFRKCLINSPSPTQSEEFIENLYKDELRSGFLVTSHRKKIWNVQIGMINEFARICKKYNLRWFAADGTLLGAARHKGFVPWDNDVDLVMFRPDYEKFLKVAPKELPEYYFLEVWYNYFLEWEDNSTYANNPNFQFVSCKVANPEKWSSDWPKFRLRDNRTTFIRPTQNLKVQTIWIDVFPFDSVPPFKDEKQTINFEVSRELLAAATNPALIADAIQNNQRLLIAHDELKKFLKLPFHQRGRLAEDFALKIFTPSEYVARTVYYVHQKNTGEPWYPPHKSDWFKEVIYLPFEKIKVPAPVGYDGFLKNYYGDWHKPVIDPNHVSVEQSSADIPYIEFFKNLSLANK